MPRPGPRLPTACIRLSPATLAQVDATAAADSRTRSDMIRVLLAEALAARGAYNDAVLAALDATGTRVQIDHEGQREVLVGVDLRSAVAVEQRAGRPSSRPRS